MEDLVKNIRIISMGIVFSCIIQAPLGAIQPSVIKPGFVFVKEAQARLAKAFGIGAAVGAGVGAVAHKKLSQSLLSRFQKPVAPVAVPKVSPWYSMDGIKTRIKNVLPTSESIKATITKKGPGIAAKTAALLGAGAAGYAASALAAQGALEKCLIGVAGVTLAAGSYLSLGISRTAALYLATAAGWIAHNRVDINALVQKWSVGEDAPAQGGTQFDRWEIQRWPTAKDLSDNEAAVITQLRTDIADANGSFHIEHHPELHAHDRLLDDRVTWKDVLYYIQQDIALVKRDRKYLDDKYLTYLNLWPSLYTGFGIKRRYATLCKSAGVTEISPGEFQDSHYWTRAQIAALAPRIPNELFVPRSVKGKCVQYALKPNFTAAAQLWWYLKKAQERLEELERCVKKLGADTVVGPLPTYCAICGRWAQPGACGCHHEQVGSPTGFCQPCAGGPACTCPHCPGHRR
jgi:hypothetical protein